MSELERRIAGSKFALELISLIDAKDLNDPTYMQGLVNRFGRYLPQLEEPSTNKVPIARLGTMVLQFGQYASKCFDDIPLDYLDWLCGSSQEVAKSIKLYLNHPELETRRRGLER